VLNRSDDRQVRKVASLLAQALMMRFSGCLIYFPTLNLRHLLYCLALSQG
jgi:hypothetical protein